MAVITNAINHPLIYPIMNPPKVIQIVIRYVGTFSPIAPYISIHSLVSLLAKAFGFT